MAVCCNGMTPAETAALTLAMRDSGRVLHHDDVTRPKIDKHSTGGVGDKVSLLLAPLVAAAGVAVPMVSGRGLGHTGGTIDKLASLPGYRTDLSGRTVLAGARAVRLRDGGAQRRDRAADRRMYATRDISGTVESIPLITSSILSKKLAEGIDGLVMDVKCGRAAFMQQEHDAVLLMESLVATGAGRHQDGGVVDRHGPSARPRARQLARGGGGDRRARWALPRRPARGHAGARRRDVAAGGCAADAEMARRRWCGFGMTASCGRCSATTSNCRAGTRACSTIRRCSGARRSFCRSKRARGFVERRRSAGELGRVVVDLGGGRRQPADAIDPHVGIVLKKVLGDAVETGDVLAFVHARDAAAAKSAVARVLAAMPVGQERRRRGPLVLRRMA
jgi:thymidine phosphorylase